MLKKGKKEEKQRSILEEEQGWADEANAKRENAKLMMKMFKIIIVLIILINIFVIFSTESK